MYRHRKATTRSATYQQHLGSHTSASIRTTGSCHETSHERQRKSPSNRKKIVRHSDHTISTDHIYDRTISDSVSHIFFTSLFRTPWNPLAISCYASQDDVHFLTRTLLNLSEGFVPHRPSTLHRTRVDGASYRTEKTFAFSHCLSVEPYLQYPSIPVTVYLTTH